MTTVTLTPQSNQNPAVVNVAKELSGSVWPPRFPGSRSTEDLIPTFKTKVDAFLGALLDAGGKRDITSTFRPRQRSYMMHWSYRIYKEDFDPLNVPPMSGVNIEWVHPTRAQSVSAAGDMVRAFGIHLLGVPPSLQSLHMVREAIDVRIWWTGDLRIKNASGNLVIIDTLPRTGMNAQLKSVGLSYGVVKFVGGATDKPHWSTTGH